MEKFFWQKSGGAECELEYKIMEKNFSNKIEVLADVRASLSCLCTYKETRKIYKIFIVLSLNIHCIVMCFNSFEIKSLGFFFYQQNGFRAKVLVKKKSSRLNFFSVHAKQIHFMLFSFHLQWRKFAALRHFTSYKNKVNS